MLDDAGLADRAKISVSNSLDEYLIQRSHARRARRSTCSAWASGSSPRAASRCSAACTSWPPWRTSRRQRSMPKIKISENVGKITNPHFKKLYRLFGNDTGKAIADYLCVLRRDGGRQRRTCEIFDPEATWKTQGRSTTSRPRSCRCPIFRNGELVYQTCRTLDEIQRLLPPSRWIPSGTRSSALTTRIPTMWTCPKSSGRSSMTCSKTIPQGSKKKHRRAAKAARL